MIDLVIDNSGDIQKNVVLAYSGVFKTSIVNNYTNDGVR